MERESRRVGEGMDARGREKGSIGGGERGRERRRERGGECRWGSVSRGEGGKE